jgi:hypothetical protein
VVVIGRRYLLQQDICFNIFGSVPDNLGYIQENSSICFSAQGESGKKTKI